MKAISYFGQLEKVCGPPVTTGEYSLKVLTKKAVAAGLTNRTGGGALARSRIHQVLQNPIYHGEFYWLGQLHRGLHKPIISRDLYDRVQAVFAAANHPRHTKRRHAFAGLVTCGRCVCAFTAEIKKGLYAYYHCTGHGPCGNTYVREEELIRQFGELLKQVRIPTELAGKLATVLRESQTDKEKFVRTSMLRLQQQRTNRLFLVCCEESARTGAFDQKAGIELHVRSRKSFSHLR